MAQTKPEIVQRTKQSTFGKTYVNHYSGNHRCDKVTGFDKNGEIKRCDNRAKFAIFRVKSDAAEFYCGVHTKPDWKEMVGKTEVNNE